MNSQLPGAERRDIPQAELPGDGRPGNAAVKSSVAVRLMLTRSSCGTPLRVSGSRTSSTGLLGDLGFGVGFAGDRASPERAIPCGRSYRRVQSFRQHSLAFTSLAPHWWQSRRACRLVQGLHLFKPRSLAATYPDCSRSSRTEERLPSLRDEGAAPGGRSPRTSAGPVSLRQPWMIQLELDVASPAGADHPHHARRRR